MLISGIVGVDQGEEGTYGLIRYFTYVIEPPAGQLGGTDRLIRFPFPISLKTGYFKIPSPAVGDYINFWVAPEFYLAKTVALCPGGTQKLYLNPEAADLFHPGQHMAFTSTFNESTSTYLILNSELDSINRCVLTVCTNELDGTGDLPSDIQSNTNIFMIYKIMDKCEPIDEAYEVLGLEKLDAKYIPPNVRLLAQYKNAGLTAKRIVFRLGLFV